MPGSGRPSQPRRQSAPLRSPTPAPSASPPYPSRCTPPLALCRERAEARGSPPVNTQLLVRHFGGGGGGFFERGGASPPAPSPFNSHPLPQRRIQDEGDP